jgi:hypothetical protein
VQGFSIAFGRARGHARQLLVSSSRLGRRSAALGALLLIGSTVTVLATANTPPTITSLTVTPSVLNEGQTVTLSGTFTDPDVGDFHTVRIGWRDSPDITSGFRQQVQLAPGQTTFQVTHTYTDNVAPTTIKVSVIDRRDPPGSNDNTPGAGGTDFGFVPIEVRSVPPRFVDSSIVGTASAGGVVVEGDFTDPGTDDTIQVTATIGGPFATVPMSCSLGKGGRHFRCEYTHRPSLAPRTYTVNLRVSDDDGGQDTHTMTVRFDGTTHP